MKIQKVLSYIFIICLSLLTAIFISNITVKADDSVSLLLEQFESQTTKASLNIDYKSTDNVVDAKEVVKYEYLFSSVLNANGEQTSVEFENVSLSFNEVSQYDVSTQAINISSNNEVVFESQYAIEKIEFINLEEDVNELSNPIITNGVLRDGIIYADYNVTNIVVEVTSDTSFKGVNIYLRTGETVSLNNEEYTVNTISLRFGTMISTELYDGLVSAGATFGVAATRSGASEKYFSCTPVRVNENSEEDAEGNYYQFALVLNNIPENDYDISVNGRCFVEIDGVKTFMQATKYSVMTLAYKYASNEVTSGYSEHLGILDSLRRNTYNISYVLDGGTNSVNNIDKFAPYMNNFELEEPTKEGFQFLGWFTESTFENKVEYITEDINSDITLYAKFVEIGVTQITPIQIVGYNSQSAVTGYAQYYGTRMYKYGEAIGSSLYWYKVAIVEENGRYKVSEIAVSGASTPSTYDYLILSFEANDNELYKQLKNSGLVVGDYITFSTDLDNLQNGEVSLTVQREIPVFSNLKLETNDGDVSYNNTFSNIEEVVLPTPKKVGYTFLGWYENESFSGSPVTTIPMGTIGDKTYYAKWEQYAFDITEGENIWEFVSNPVTSNTKDELPLVYGDYTITWSSSNNDLYTISDGIGYTNRLHQTHKKQAVTLTVNITNNEETITKTKEITINPVLFDEMNHPGAVYFSVSTGDSYKLNSARYQEEGTLFSEKFRENMDMVYYAFAVPQADGTLTLSTTYINEIMQLKNDGIRVLLVIDGANKEPLQAMVQLCNADDTRAIFVNNILELIETYNFDGVDVDWEFPGTSDLDGFTTEIDQVNLNKLLRDLRNGLTAMQDEGGSNYILSVAIPATSWGSQRYDYVGDETLGGIDDYCDYVNMMSYDLNNTSYTSHVAAHASSTASGNYSFGTIYGVERFVSLGLSREKIILGTAAYGKTYTITGDIDMTVQYPGLGLAGTLSKIADLSGSYASGTIYYTAIQQLINGGGYTKYTEMNNGNIVGSYLLNPSAKIYITYDSKEAVQAKCEYANQYEGMGVMVWAYGEDATDTVVNTICDTLN